MINACDHFKFPSDRATISAPWRPTSLRVYSVKVKCVRKRSLQGVILCLLVSALVGVFGCDSSELPSSSSQSQRSIALPPLPTPLLPSPPVGGAGPATPLAPLARLSQSAAIDQATKASDSLLKLFDQGEYRSAWEQSGARFKAAVLEDPWCKQIAAIRTAMGPILSRKLAKTTYKTGMFGEPSGEYVVVDYSTSFANRRDKPGKEEVTLIREPDGVWRALGYYIN
jgi:hypothetical protein